MQERTIPVVEEQAEVAKRRRATGLVRVRTTVHESLQPIETELESETVDIRRVPQDRFVDAPVPDRREGDTLIMSVVEEVAVVETRLKVVEEIHITRRRDRTTVNDEVPVRRQEVEIKRENP